MNERHYFGITRKTTASNYIKAAVVQDWVNMIYPDIETLSIQYGLHAEVVTDIIESILLNSNIKNPIIIILKSAV